MASSYTSNYQLCQWEAGDKVLRTDFNGDNQKIDAALARADTSSKLHQLGSVTLAENSAAITFTLPEGFDWSKWRRIHCVCSIDQPTPGIYYLFLRKASGFEQIAYSSGHAHFLLCPMGQGASPIHGVYWIEEGFSGFLAASAFQDIVTIELGAGNPTNYPLQAGSWAMLLGEAV